jgi:hypothetical protein
MKTVVLPKFKVPVMSDALRAWLDEQRRFIAETRRRENRRPEELVMPAALVPDAADYQEQLTPTPSAPVGGMTAFGIPVRVESQFADELGQPD